LEQDEKDRHKHEPRAARDCRDTKATATGYNHGTTTTTKQQRHDNETDNDGDRDTRQRRRRPTTSTTTAAATTPRNRRDARGIVVSKRTTRSPLGVLGQREQVVCGLGADQRHHARLHVTWMGVRVCACGRA
jgi:hypothetical protein